jgi:hypothetical protein
MNINLIIEDLEIILNEYASIDSSDDLRPFAENIDSPSSTLNNLQNLIGDPDIAREMLQSYHNRAKSLIINRIGQEFLSFPFNEYSKVHSIFFNRIKIFSYINNLITIDNFQFFDLFHCFREVEKNHELFPLLREHLKWSYREKIITSCIYKLDPYNYPKKYGYPDFHSSDAQSAYVPFEQQLRNAIKHQIVKFDFPYPNQIESFESFYEVRKDRKNGNISEFELSLIFNEFTKDKPLDQVEFLLRDILLTILSRRREMKPNEEEIEKRKEEFIINGQTVPLVDFIRKQSDKDDVELDESERYDYDKLFPEIYNKIKYLDDFREYLVNQIKTTYEMNQACVFAPFQITDGIYQKVNSSRLENPEQPLPRSLDEIFLKAEMIERCINVLRQLDKPVIDSKLNYIGNNKSVVCVWIDELVRSNFIKKQKDNVFSALVNIKFPDLQMTKDGSLFRKTSKRAEETRKDIQVLLSQISLSGK